MLTLIDVIRRKFNFGEELRKPLLLDSLARPH